MGLSYRHYSGYNTRPGKSAEIISILVDDTKRVKSTIPVLACHGWEVGPAPYAHWTSPDASFAFRKLANLGFVCASADFGGGSNWGNDEGHLSIPEALTFLNGKFGTSTTSYAMVMFSMGNLYGLNRIWRFPAQLKVGAMVIPAVNLQNIHDRNVLGMEASIDAAYTNHAGYLAGLATHSPALNASLVAPVGSKIKCWRSSDDNVTFAAEVDAFCTAAGITRVDLGAVGHSTTGMNMMDLFEWIYQGARRR